LDRRIGGPQSGSGCGNQTNPIITPCRKLDSGRAARRPVTVPTDSCPDYLSTYCAQEPPHRHV